MLQCECCSGLAYNHLDCFSHRRLETLNSDCFSKKGVGSKLINLLMRGKKCYSLFRCCCFTSPHFKPTNVSFYTMKYILFSKYFYNMKKSAPIIEPINVRQFEFKQSDYEMADKLPFRSIVVSASQGGKGILIQNLVLKIYRGCFERIYIVSPTAHIDEAYREVIKYIEKDLKVDAKKNNFCLTSMTLRRLNTS